MNTNLTFDDDFDAISSAQPSGYIQVAEAPDLSQAAWYDLEDEQPPAKKAAPSANVSSRRVKKQVYQPPVNQYKTAGAGTSSKATQHAARKLFSPRLVILLVILVALIGGVTLSSFFASAKQNTNQSVMQPVLSTMQGMSARPTIAPTKVPAQPTLAATATAVPTGTMNGLPDAWVASGRGPVEMSELLSVAATFVQRYETIDFRSPSTLTASEFILTNAAKERFNNGNKRSTDAFAAQIQQEQLMQAAFVHSAILVKAQKRNSCFFAWVTVSYQLDVQQGTKPASTTDNLMLTIMLVAIPFGTPQSSPAMGGIGWQVSTYHTGTAIAPIPDAP